MNTTTTTTTKKTLPPLTQAKILMLTTNADMEIFMTPLGGQATPDQEKGGRYD
jgi:hypothetical protein